MKSNGFIKRFAFSVLLALGTVTGAFAQGGGGNDGMVLLGGTNFEPITPVGDDKYYIGISEVATIGLLTPSITVGEGLSVPTDAQLDYKYSGSVANKGEAISSNFQNSNKLYAITPNPSLIDNLDYIDDENWGFLLGPQTGGGGSNLNFLTFSLRGLAPHKAVRVEVEYRTVIIKDAVTTAIKKCGDGSGRAEFRISCNADANNILQGKMTDQIGVPAEGKFVEKGTDVAKDKDLDPGTNMCADKNGNLTLYFNASKFDACCVFQITSIKVYGQINPEIFSVDGETVCAGEFINLKTKNIYNGATYEWYVNNEKKDATSANYSFETPATPKDYEIQLAVTYDGVKTKSNVLKVKSEKCCEVTGPDGTPVPASRKIVFKDDFGEFDLSDKTGKTYKVWNYTDVSNPIQETKTTTSPFRYELGEAPLGCTFDGGPGPLNDGFYCVAGCLTGYNASQGVDGAKLQWANRIGGKMAEHQVDPELDHSGEFNGCALFINCNPNTGGKNIYSRKIENLCQNRQLFFECYYTVFTSDAAGPYNPVDITVRLTEIGNERNSVEVVGQKAYPEADGGSGTWIKLKSEIFLEQFDALLLEIVNNSNVSENGNDIVIDDIIIRACAAPSLQAYFDDVTFATDTVTCDNGDNLIKVFANPSEMLTNYFGGSAKTRYLYQWTLTPDDKKSWKRIGDITKDLSIEVGSDPFAESLGLQTGDKVYFRAIAGSEYQLSIVTDDKFNSDDPCASYTISEPIECIIDCPTCTEPASKIKIKADKDASLQKKNNKDVIELCFGESVTLSQAADITPAQSDWASSEFIGYSIKWFEDAEKYDDLTGAETKLNDLVSDVIYSNTDETSTSTVEKRIVLYAIDAKYPKGTCKTADTIYIKFHPKPKAKYRQDAVEFCEGKGDGVVELTMVDGTESDYQIKWWAGADSTGTSLGEGLDENFFKDLESNESGVYSYLLIDKETHCKGDLYNYDVTVNPQPEKPEEETLVYAVNTESRWAVGTDQLLKNTVLTGIVWYENLTDPDANGSALGTVIDRTVTTEAPNSPIIKYIAYKDGNCYSERVPVTINIKKAPTPNLKDLKLCKGNSFDPMEGVVGSEAGYELVWFKPENVPNDTVGKALTTAPVDHVKTDVPGEYKMYAAYRQTSDPYAQGDIAEYTVTVYGVDKPLDKSKHEYCANDNGELLKADIVEDHTNFLYANEVVYLAPGASTALSEQYATTATQTTKTYTYQAYQKYNIPGTDKSCEGEPIDIDVEVIAVKAPEVLISPVSYVKSEGKATKTFDDILTKYPGAIKDEAGQTLKWSIEKNGPYAPGSSMGSQPFYDETIPDGTVENQVRYAMWEVVTSDNTCSSEPSKIEITISSTPAPIVNPITICEDVFVNGPIPTAKEPVANASLNDNNTTLNVTGYQLYWYTNKTEADAAMTTGSLANGSTIAPSLSSVAINITDKTQPKWEGEVYVVQSDGTTTSPASTLKITVNATPRLQPKAFDPVCGDKSSVDLTTGDYWNVENGVTVSTDIMHGTTPVTATANNLTEAGEYKVTATSVEGCTSDPLTLQLDIRHLSIKVEDKNTCPDGSVTQEVKINYTYNKNGAQAGTAQLQLTSDEATSTMSSQNFMVTKPAAGYDESEFFYTYTTGEFSATPKIHNVSVLVFDGVCDAATKDFKVTIGDGPADGTYKWNETGNNSPFANTSISHSDATKDNITINACGGPVDLDFSKVTKTAGDFEWYKDNSYSSSSLFFSGDKPTFTESDYGVYYVRYTNQCYSYATVTIKDASVKILTATQPDVDQCEGTAYNMTINYVCPNPDNLTHQWYKDNSLYTSGDGLSFNNLIKSDEGTYKVEYTNDGCKAELDPVVNIKVREIVQFELDENTVEKYEGKNTQIVTAGENAKVDFKFKVPSSPAGLIPTLTQDPTVNDGSVTSDNMSYTINNVDEDHRNIKVSFASADYCESSVEFQVLRDAKLVLNAKVDDVAMCLHDTRRFTIDTISTGTFRRGAGVLKVMATPETGTAKEEKDFKKNALDTLWKNISPTVTTTYKVTFDYNGQHEEQEIKVTVYNFRVVTVADTVCAGEPVELKYEVYPSDSKVEWFNEDNVSLGENPGPVTPEFKGAATAPRSTYKYYARPYSDLVTCTSSSNKFPLVVTVYRPLDGEMKDTAICQGQSVRVDASSYGASSWTWTVDGDEIVGGRVYQDTPEKTTTYYVHMTRGNVCTKDAQATVVVNTNPVIESIDSLDYREVEVLMARDFGTSPFRYQIDEGEWTEDSHLTNLAYSIHTIKVVDKNGCELLDTFKINNPAIEIRHWFSPNQDGEFDKWTVEGIQKTYPEAEFTIFDRWGKKLAEFKGADDGWDGTYNGVDMPSTDYWYELIVREIDKIYTGHFTLIRR